MSLFQQMYLIPKAVYDTFLTKANSRDIQYMRQINNVDVQDGGKVTIRNDDKIVTGNNKIGNNGGGKGGDDGKPGPTKIGEAEGENKSTGSEEDENEQNEIATKDIQELSDSILKKLIDFKSNVGNDQSTQTDNNLIQTFEKSTQNDGLGIDKSTQVDLRGINKATQKGELGIDKSIQKDVLGVDKSTQRGESGRSFATQTEQSTNKPRLSTLGTQTDEQSEKKPRVTSLGVQTEKETKAAGEQSKKLSTQNIGIQSDFSPSTQSIGVQSDVSTPTASESSDAKYLPNIGSRMRMNRSQYRHNPYKRTKIPDEERFEDITGWIIPSNHNNQQAHGMDVDENSIDNKISDDDVEMKKPRGNTLVKRVRRLKKIKISPPLQNILKNIGNTQIIDKNVIDYFIKKYNEQKGRDKGSEMTYMHQVYDSDEDISDEEQYKDVSYDKSLTYESYLIRSLPG